MMYNKNIKIKAVMKNEYTHSRPRQRFSDVLQKSP